MHACMHAYMHMIGTLEDIWIVGALLLGETDWMRNWDSFILGIWSYKAVMILL